MDRILLEGSLRPGLIAASSYLRESSSLLDILLAVRDIAERYLSLVPRMR